MAQHRILSRLLKIEYILLLYAVISIISTITFLFLESANFKYVSYEIDYCLENAELIVNWTSNHKHDFFSKLKAECTPFTYFNEDVENNLNNFIDIFMEPPENFAQSELTARYMNLYKSLNTVQHHLSFVYIWLISVSFFITIVSFLSIIQNNRLKNSEIQPDHE